ncbi:ribbon-helix-helix domain-containing protein [Pseudohoeflea coraliihabitans]|uniref:Ribbon-helix-helix domain-containing protein n=1 Tax=Pseudohoeflea coraliihabitans TaxID=2860393 RepID=A0ABS6WJ74_9HYPH|nr:ribbon-helix-helix domain-containing protein [Pseudohoeflea sp. DP4N28-3]MBW3095890.1 ribbon-helix-helix domain-containing protein [Pseudohoeflea sp. DP4N28-3]
MIKTATSDTPSTGNIKHSVTIRGHRTSISLEPRFWSCLRQMAQQRDLPLAALIAEIDAGRGHAEAGSNLSSKVRLAVLEWALAAGVSNAAAPPQQ